MNSADPSGPAAYEPSISRNGPSIPHSEGSAAAACRDLMLAIGDVATRARAGELSLDDLGSTLGIAELFPGIFAVICDTKGRFFHVTASYHRAVGIDPGHLIGRSCRDVFPAAWCDERLRLMERVARTRTPVATLELFGGRRLEGAMLPIVSPHTPPLIAFVARFGLAFVNDGSAAPARLELVRFVHADWGPLEPLTRREREVLRLIAMGLDNPGIAKLLYRTKRAIEWHIKNLYAKLHRERRVELFRLGIEAGLADIDDEFWEAMIQTRPARADN